MSAFTDKTIVKNKLTHPTGDPMSGVRVDLILRSSFTWMSDGTGRVIGKAQTWTNSEGCWREKLLPYTAYRDYVYVEVRENEQHTGFIKVEPPSFGAERWVFELLIDPPDPTPPPRPPIIRLRQLHDVQAADPNDGDALVFRDGKWHAAPVVAKLAQLLDVDPNIVDAPDGAVLMKRDGTWTAEIPALRGLADVDRSVTWANPNDVLTYLSYEQGWGSTSPKPVTIDADAAVDPNDPTLVWLSVFAFDQTKTLLVRWDDGDEPPYQVIPTPGDYQRTYSHTGQRTITVFYADESESKDLHIDITPPGVAA